MPVHSGSDAKGSFVQYGHRGAKYHYKAGDSKSKAAALAKVHKQMKAMAANGYRFDK